jgi:archaellum biogenesis ATPase FlaH
MNVTKCIPFLMMFLISTHSYSQEKLNAINNRIKVYKIAYFTNQLSLTEKEAELFWPIYNDHQKVLIKLRKEERAEIYLKNINATNINNISDIEAKVIIDSIEKIKNKITQENTTFYNKLKNILSYKKLVKLNLAEREFRKKLLERIRKRKK